MSDDTTPTVDPAGEPTPPAGDAAPQTQPKPSPPASERVEDLPDWAQKIVRDARTQAGGYRREKTALEQQLAELQTQFKTVSEAGEDATAALSAAKLAEVRLRAALQVGKSGAEGIAFAERLRGSTPEEIAEDAKTLAQFFGGPAPTQQAPRSDPSQGSAPLPLNGDPLEAAIRDHLGIA